MKKMVVVLVNNSFMEDSETSIYQIPTTSSLGNLLLHYTSEESFGEDKEEWDEEEIEERSEFSSEEWLEYFEDLPSSFTFICEGKKSRSYDIVDLLESFDVDTSIEEVLNKGRMFKITTIK